MRYYRASIALVVTVIDVIKIEKTYTILGCGIYALIEFKLSITSEPYVLWANHILFSPIVLVLKSASGAKISII